MATQLTDGTNNVPVDATSKGVVVQNPKVAAQAGYVALATNEDAGTVTGSPLVRAVSTSIDERLSVGVDTPLLSEQFNYAAQNTAIWQNNLTTMTLTYSGGYAFLNAGASTASGAFAVLKSYRPFALFQGGGLHVEFRGYLTQTPQTNNTVYIGLGTPGTTAAPTDGAYFQYSAAGLFNAVVNWGGTTLASANLTAPSANAAHEFSINVTDDNAEFWIDGVLYAQVGLPAGAGTFGLNGSAYAFVQNTNTGVVGAAQGVKISTINVWQEDVNSAKPWPHQQAGQGLMAYQGQGGGTMGTTALYANSGNPTAAVPTNTTAALGSGLGGNFWSTNTLAVNTDGIISSYQNPAGSVNQTPRNLVITGVKIDSAVLASLAGGPEILMWSLAFGHTSVSLATAEGAAAKAPRRVSLGIQTFGSTAPIGTLATPIVVQLQSPIVVQPGEFVQAVYKNIGTVGTAGTIAHNILFDGYWE